MRIFVTAFHICVVDGVFETVDGEDGSQVKFHVLAHLSADAIAQVQNEAKRRIVRAFVKRGLLDSIDGEVMLLARHGGGFSVDASVCIAGAAIRGDDTAGLERLLRYCARPPFAMERLHRMGQEHLPKFHTAHCPKPQSGGAAIRGNQGDLILTPCEFIAKIAALVPPAPPSLLWRLGTELAVPSRNHCHDAHVGDATRCATNRGRPRGPSQHQTFASTLPVGETDRADL